MRWNLSLKEATLCIIDSCVGQKQQFEVKTMICFLQTCSFSLQDVNLWTGVVWITFGLL